MFELYCLNCKKVAEETTLNGICSCGGLLDTRYSGAEFLVSQSSLGMWKFRNFLPVGPSVTPVSLGEGDTPLLSSKLSDSPKLFFKDESQNPTGSMKDRALSLAITKAKELGIKRATLFSAGSTGLAAASYAAKADLNLTVFVGETTPTWRYTQMHVMGAKVVRVKAAADELMNLLEAVANKKGIYQLTTCRRANPYQAEAPKTIAYEIAQQLKDAPDWVILPIGGGGTISGIWKGFQELRSLGVISKLPRLLGVQLRGYDALVHALEKELDEEKEVADLLLGTPEVDTVCTKLTHKFPHDSMETLQAVRKSEGTIFSFTDEDAIRAMYLVGKTDGLFIEPSSAMAVAGFLRAKEKDLIKADDTVVCVLSGSAFRELPLLDDFLKIDDLKTISASEEELETVL